ncbi:hypothetical protein QEH56_06825 [Pelagicoccus enzymogenes]|uniref:hypothetical protein n=1 Tax=Pelagicoccus enzymogenes TaxID=2773457 RepID=UPI00280E57BC|nr:hypothetical protein [Pelagicoccus enzymogenes]MDQ8197852.1 hypothetical protein [Pelagicoccus enzymogenes]
MIRAIDRFCLNPISIPKNEDGRLGIIGLLLILPLSLPAALTGRYDLLLAWMALSLFLTAPYMLLVQLLFFAPIIVAAVTDDLEMWIERNINYSVFTFLCLILGLGLFFWRGPETEVAKNYERNKKKKVQPGSPHNAGKRPPLS